MNLGRSLLVIKYTLVPLVHNHYVHNTIRLFNHDVKTLKVACERFIKATSQSRPTTQTPWLTFSPDIEVREVLRDKEVFKGHITPLTLRRRINEVWRERQLELSLMMILLPLSLGLVFFSHPRYSPPPEVPNLSWNWWHGFWERGASALLVSSFTYFLVALFHFLRGMSGSIVWDRPGD
jgi:hypothetical protein